MRRALREGRHGELSIDGDSARTRHARYRGAPQRRVGAIVAVLSLAVFMSSLDLFIVNLAFPYIGQEYPGTSLSSLSWVLNAYTIVFAAVLVPAGRWADRIGRRRVFVAGLAAFTWAPCCAGSRRAWPR